VGIGALVDDVIYVVNWSGVEWMHAKGGPCDIDHLLLHLDFQLIVSLGNETFLQFLSLQSILQWMVKRKGRRDLQECGNW